MANGIRQKIWVTLENEQKKKTTNKETGLPATGSRSKFRSPGIQKKKNKSLRDLQQEQMSAIAVELPEIGALRSRLPHYTIYTVFFDLTSGRCKNPSLISALGSLFLDTERNGEQKKACILSIMYLYFNWNFSNNY